MITDNSEKRNQRYATMRSIKDYGMGVLYFIIAVFMIFPEVFKSSLDVAPLIRYMFGGICILYGSWRIYRGYKKEYFKKDEV
jgi:hypothetical protein